MDYFIVTLFENRMRLQSVFCRLAQERHGEYRSTSDHWIVAKAERGTMADIAYGLKRKGAQEVEAGDAREGEL